MITAGLGFRLRPSCPDAPQVEGQPWPVPSHHPE